MTVHQAGFFRELRHGFPDGPSIVENRGKLSGDAVSRVVSYLRGGSTLATTGSMADDWFDPSRTDVAPLEVRTDGIWVWSGDLAYYVERYGVQVPHEMLTHMASRGWRASELPPEELAALEVEMFPDTRRAD
jgi:hypothetical protein